MGEGVFKGAETAMEMLDKFDADIAENVKDRREYNLKFPAKPYTPEDSIQKDWNFKWRVDKTVVYRSAYYSHIRVTLRSKDDEGKALKKIIKPALPNVKKKHLWDNRDALKWDEFKKVCLDAASVKLAKQYESMYTKSSNRPMFKTTYLNTHKGILKDQDFATDAKFGIAMAKIVLGDKERRKKELEPLIREQWLNAAYQVTAALNPGENAQNITRGTIAAQSNSLSASIPYAIGFVVLKPDMKEAALRIDKLVLDNTSIVQTQLIKNREALADLLKAVTRAEDSDKSRIGGTLRPWSDQTNSAKALYQDAIKDQDELKKKLAGIADRAEEFRGEVMKFADYRRIASVAAYPLAEGGGYPMQIYFRNTQAMMEVDIEKGTTPKVVRIHLDYTETASNKVPKGVPLAETWSAFLEQITPADGDLEFDIEGNLTKATGKVGEKFKKLMSQDIKVVK